MPEITYAPIQERWAEELAAIERAAFPTAGTVDLLSVDDIRTLCGTFPEGGFVALDGDRPVGMGVGILIDFDFDTFQNINRSHVEAEGIEISSQLQPTDRLRLGIDWTFQNVVDRSLLVR